jgi:hypothetical protein
LFDRGIPFNRQKNPLFDKGIPCTGKGNPFNRKGFPFICQGIPSKTRELPAPARKFLEKKGEEKRCQGRKKGARPEK